MRAPVLCLALAIPLVFGACGGEATGGSDDTSTAAAQSDAVSGEGQSASADASSTGEDWCFSSAECTEPNQICTVDYGDCQGCADPAEVCCGVCALDPCADKACGQDCFCPPGSECAELPMSCNAEGLCVTVNNDLGCEEPEPYDPCADKACGEVCDPCGPDDDVCPEIAVEFTCDAEGQCGDNDSGCEAYDACAEKACGDECNPCAPGDEECAMRPGLPHFCDAEGACSNNEPEDLDCVETCVVSNECGTDEVCTTAYGACITCAGDGAADPVCCGTCEPDPCADKACGQDCFCPPGLECAELPMSCNAEGLCVTVNNDLGCEEPEPYDPCKDAACGASCNPCPPGDDACETPGSAPHFCNSEGACVDEAPEGLGCAQSCVTSGECGEGQVCTTDFFACETCEGPGGAEPVCCGQCVDNPCMGKACGESCQCPEGTSCPEVPWACDASNACVTANKVECEADDPCKDAPCGTLCGDNQVCDAEGGCVPSPDGAIDAWCAGQSGACMSSDDCELGEYCTLSDGDCVACTENSPLTVCCGTCAPFDPCKDKNCGAMCGPCPFDQQECLAPAVEMYCNNEGQCSETQSACDM